MPLAPAPSLAAPQQAPPTATQQADQASVDNAATPAAQAPAYVGPSAQPAPTFFGRLLQGALNGLAGGIQSGAQNVAGAGTAGFTPQANGMAYAQQLQDKQDNMARQKTQDAAGAAQQQFENQTQQFKAQQDAERTKAEAYQGHLQAILMHQNIQHADQATQDKFYDDNKRILSEAQEDPNTKVLATIPHVALDGMSAHDRMASYIQQHPDYMSDPNAHAIATQDGDGNLDIHILKYDPTATVSAEETNKRLSSIGSDEKVPAGSSMSVHDAHTFIADRMAKVAQQHFTAAEDEHKAMLQRQNELAVGQQRIGGELQVQKEKENATLNGLDSDPRQPLPPTLERNVDSIAKGDLTPQQATGGVGKDAAARKQVMTARYDAKYRDPKSPDYDPKALPFERLEDAHNIVQKKSFQDQVQGLGELYGTKAADGTTSTGALNKLETVMKRIDAKYPAVAKPDANFARFVMSHAGDADVEELKAIAPDVATKQGKVTSGGGSGNETQYHDFVNSIIAPRNRAALDKSISGLRDLGGETLRSLRTEAGQYSVNAVAHINDPGTDNDTALNSKTPSGDRSRPSGADRLVKGSDGHKYYSNAKRENLGRAD